MTHWIDAVDDMDIELLGMSDDELTAFAYDHAEPVEVVLPPKPRVAAPHPEYTLPQAA